MTRPQEFTVHIEPDGRIVLNLDGLEETSYRRILDLLAETVGPVQEVGLSPEDPPRRFLHSASAPSESIELGRGHSKNQ